MDAKIPAKLPKIETGKRKEVSPGNTTYQEGRKSDKPGKSNCHQGTPRFRRTPTLRRRGDKQQKITVTQGQTVTQSSRKCT